MATLGIPEWASMAADIIKTPAHTCSMIPTSKAIAEEARNGRRGRRVHRSRKQRMHRISNDLGGAAEPLVAQPARPFRRNQRAGPSPMVWTLGRCADMAVPLANINIGCRAVSAAMGRFRRAAGPLIERSFSF